MTNEEIQNKTGVEKFSICLMNPPFSGSLHLKFLDKVTDLCEKSVVIEPSSWLIQLKENGKYTKEDSLAVKIKNKIDKHVKSIELNNYIKELNVNMTNACSISCIDFSKQYNEINFECVNETSKVKSLKDCNLVGNHSLIKSIIDKCKAYSTHMIDHCVVTKKYKEYENKDYWFSPYGNYRINTIGSNQGYYHKMNQKTKFGTYYNCYTGVLTFNTSKYNIIPKGVRKGSPVDCVYGAKEEIENWNYYCLNNKLPLFISICLTIDENNNVKPYIPWIVDKKYTDEEIYKLLDITEEEQELIDNVIYKYERSSEFAKKYFPKSKEIQ